MISLDYGSAHPTRRSFPVEIESNLYLLWWRRIAAEAAFSGWRHALTRNARLGFKAASEGLEQWLIACWRNDPGVEQ